MVIISTPVRRPCQVVAYVTAPDCHIPLASLPQCTLTLAKDLQEYLFALFFWHPSIASPKSSLMCARRGYLEYGFALCLTMILLTLKLCNYEKVSVTLTCWRGFDEPNHICQYSLIGLGGG